MKSFRPYLLWFVAALLVTVAAIRAMTWVRDHPEHWPGARFELAHPQGWATHRKLIGLAGDDAGCFAAFERAGRDISGGLSSARAPAVPASAWC